MSAFMRFFYVAYVQPVRGDMLAQFLLGLIFASGVFVWSTSGFHMSVPSFDTLLATSGTIDFSKDPLRRGGDFTTIKTQDGSELSFSCEGGRKSDRDCLLRSEQAQWRGRSATVWWFPSTTSAGGKWRSLAQLEVDGQIVLSYDDLRRAYEETNLVFATSVVLFVVGLSAYVLILPFRASKERSA